MTYMDLTHRVAIITGAAQGIGFAISKRLASAGAQIAIVDINSSGAQGAVDMLAEDRAKAHAFACDVSDPTSVQSMIDDVLHLYNRIDILVNNAGIVGPSAPIQDQTDDDWNQMIGIDLTGVFLCCRAVVPHMRKAGGGRIINIASIAGKEGNPNMVPYSAAKAGVIGLTKSNAKELARYNILVNAIAPSAWTRMTLETSDEWKKAYLAKIPLGRVGDPEKDIAPVAVFLASADSNYITGQVIVVSGGLDM